MNKKSADVDRMREIAAKIIADYKAHYAFPWQGESHMEDCIMGNLQALRGAVLEKAARACPAEATSYECRQRIRALKREPSAEVE